jgi:hypothetical protein
MWLQMRAKSSRYRTDPAIVGKFKTNRGAQPSPKHTAGAPNTSTNYRDCSASFRQSRKQTESFGF